MKTNLSRKVNTSPSATSWAFNSNPSVSTPATRADGVRLHRQIVHGAALLPVERTEVGRDQKLVRHEGKVGAAIAAKSLSWSCRGRDLGRDRKELGSDVQLSRDSC